MPSSRQKRSEVVGDVNKKDIHREKGRRFKRNQNSQYHGAKTNDAPKSRPLRKSDPTINSTSHENESFCFGYFCFDYKDLEDLIDTYSEAVSPDDRPQRSKSRSKRAVSSPRNRVVSNLSDRDRDQSYRISNAVRRIDDKYDRGATKNRKKSNTVFNSPCVPCLKSSLSEDTRKSNPQREDNHEMKEPYEALHMLQGRKEKCDINLRINEVMKDSENVGGIVGDKFIFLGEEKVNSSDSSASSPSPHLDRNTRKKLKDGVKHETIIAPSLSHTDALESFSVPSPLSTKRTFTV